ncbi:MAG: hypothetical protein GWN59_03855, partial [Calditrichae bacterium]|nr:hypothetical protein [Calditrichia bacterium]
IVLDEPIKLKPNTKLIITVLPESDLKDDQDQEEQEAWFQIAMNGLERAYNEDEVEYSLDLIKEPNPDYDRR